MVNKKYFVVNFIAILIIALFYFLISNVINNSYKQKIIDNESYLIGNLLNKYPNLKEDIISSYLIKDNYEIGNNLINEYNLITIKNIGTVNTRYCFAIKARLKGSASLIDAFSSRSYELILCLFATTKSNTFLKFKWYIIGVENKSNYVKFIESAINIKSGNNHIVYLGKLDANMIIEYLLNSTFYIHPSYIDNSPNSLCEAQYLGVPSIACFTGGIPTLIEHKVSGILTSINDPFELASYIIQYHDNEEFLSKLSLSEILIAEKRHNKLSIINNTIEIRFFFISI